MFLAALPLSLRTASGFPSDLFELPGSASLRRYRLHRNEAKPGRVIAVEGKSEAFRKEGGQAAPLRSFLPSCPLIVFQTQLYRLYRPFPFESLVRRARRPLLSYRRDTRHLLSRKDSGMS